MNDDEIRKFVREHYAEVATGDRTHNSARKTEDPGCCAPQETTGANNC